MIAIMILTVIATLIVMTGAGLALIACLTVRHLNNQDTEEK